MTGSFEQMPKPTPARPPTRAKRAASESRKFPQKRSAKAETRPSGVPSTFSLGMLLLGLALSAFNLWLMTSRVGSLNGLEQSWQSLLGNYGARSQKNPEPMKPTPPPEESVRLLYSVTDGESILPGLQEKLADPIVDYYKAAGTDLNAVLVERKQPLSKVVRVRLFFAGGTETEFLWPFTDKESDWWIPPCTLNTDKSELPACPADFLAKYSEIRTLMLKKK